MEVTLSLGFNELSFFDNFGHALIEPTQYTVWIFGDSLATQQGYFHIQR